LLVVLSIHHDAQEAESQIHEPASMAPGASPVYRAA
jgi:hypothetical protein